MYTKFSSHCQLSIQSVLNIQHQERVNVWFDSTEEEDTSEDNL